MEVITSIGGGGYSSGMSEDMSVDSSRNNNGINGHVTVNSVKKYVLSNLQTAGFGVGGSYFDNGKYHNEVSDEYSLIGAHLGGQGCMDYQRIKDS